MKKLDMRDWAVIPFGSEEGYELTLSTCTSVFAYQMDGMTTNPKQGAPYLVTHNPDLPVLGMNPNDDMVYAMSAEEFTGGDRKICLAEILWRYRKELGEEYDARLGVYMINGLRAVPSDLAVARYFVASGAVRGDYELMGANLGMRTIVRAQFNPPGQRIDVFEGLKEAAMFSYRLGERREINLGSQ